MAKKQKLLVAIELNEAIKVIGGERFEALLKGAGVDLSELTLPQIQNTTETTFLGGEMMPSDLEAVVERWLQGDMLHPINSGSQFTSFLTLRHLDTLKTLHFVQTTADTFQGGMHKGQKELAGLLEERDKALTDLQLAKTYAEQEERKNRNATLIKEETQKSYNDLQASIQKFDNTINLYSQRYGNPKTTKLNWFQKIGAAIFGIC